MRYWDWTFLKIAIDKEDLLTLEAHLTDSKQEFFIDKKEKPESGISSKAATESVYAPDAVGPADYKDCRIQYLKGTFHFRRKIHMPWCIKQRHLHIFQRKLACLEKMVIPLSFPAHTYLKRHLPLSTLPIFRSMPLR